jgi:hypothetical protein
LECKRLLLLGLAGEAGLKILIIGRLRAKY